MNENARMRIEILGFNPCSNGSTTRDADASVTTSGTDTVSILVLMEVLRERFCDKSSPEPTSPGFNPCSNGSTTRDLSLTAWTLSIQHSFNPCSNGSTTRDNRCARFIPFPFRFNPCSNGSTTREQSHCDSPFLIDTFQSLF